MIEESEVVEEIIDEVVDTTKKIFTQRDVRYAAIGGLLLGSFLTGTISYLIGRRRRNAALAVELESFEVRVEDNPDQLKLELDAEQLPELKKRWTDELIPNDIISAMRDNEEVGPTGPSGSGEVIQHKTTTPILPNPPIDPRKITVHGEGVEGWDYTVELTKRHGKDIYIIHRDEFWSNEKEYTQSTLTYYSSDDILVDEDDSPIYNHATIVGEFNFGHGSGDPNVVYIRNVTREAEYEVLFDQGSYMMEVLGLEADQNMDKEPSRPSKFKSEE